MEEEAVAAVLHLPFLATNCYACLRAVVAAIPCSTCSQVSNLYILATNWSGCLKAVVAASPRASPAVRYPSGMLANKRSACWGPCWPPNPSPLALRHHMIFWPSPIPELGRWDHYLELFVLSSIQLLSWPPEVPPVPIYPPTILATRSTTCTYLSTYYPGHQKYHLHLSIHLLSWPPELPPAPIYAPTILATRSTTCTYLSTYYPGHQKYHLHLYIHLPYWPPEVPPAPIYPPTILDTRSTTCTYLSTYYPGHQKYHLHLSIHLLSWPPEVPPAPIYPPIILASYCPSNLRAKYGSHPLLNRFPTVHLPSWTPTVLSIWRPT